PGVARGLNNCSALLGQGVLIRLMQPRIAFEILPFLPRSPFLSLVLPPSSFARAPWFEALPAAFHENGVGERPQEETHAKTRSSRRRCRPPRARARADGARMRDSCRRRKSGSDQLYAL